jgi:hypothetical protein
MMTPPMDHPTGLTFRASDTATNLAHRQRRTRNHAMPTTRPPPPRPRHRGLLTRRTRSRTARCPCVPFGDIQLRAVLQFRSTTFSVKVAEVTRSDCSTRAAQLRHHLSAWPLRRRGDVADPDEQRVAAHRPVHQRCAAHRAHDRNPRRADATASFTSVEPPRPATDTWLARVGAAPYRGRRPDAEEDPPVINRSAVNEARPMVSGSTCLGGVRRATFEGEFIDLP